MQRPLYNEYTPPQFARQTMLRANYSESGEFLGRTKQRTYLESPLRWSMLTRAWVDANWYAAIKAIEAEPFAVAPIPSARTDVLFGQTTGPVSPMTETASGYMTTEISIRGYGYD
jgi:hypothetical protein